MVVTGGLGVWMRVRELIRSSAAVIAAALMLFAGQATVPAHADPTTVDDAKAQVAKLDQEAGEIGEQYAEAQIRLADGRDRVELLNRDIAAQQAKVDALSRQARAIALIQFQNRNVDPTVQLFTSDDPEAFLSRLSTASKVDENMNSLLQDYQGQEANLSDLRRAVTAEVAALSAEEQRLADLDRQIKAKVAQGEALVQRLTAAERSSLDSRDSSREAIDIADDGSVDPRALAAVRYAVSKVPGGNYVWGAAGPTNFDCSGLTMAAYRSVGVSLPHSSRGQYGVGRPVSRANLKPGDLIFWYSPIHHVGMYMGNGKIVHARNVRADLVIQTLSSYPAPYTGARRVLG